MMMERTEAEVRAKVAELGGWFDGGKIRFPSIDAHEEFKVWRWGNPASRPAA
jgi:hypothetical protein